MLAMTMACVLYIGVMVGTAVVHNLQHAKSAQGGSSVEAPDTSPGSSARSEDVLLESVCDVLRVDNSPEGERRAVLQVRELLSDEFGYTTQESANLVANALTTSCPEFTDTIVGLAQ